MASRTKVISFFLILTFFSTSSFAKTLVAITVDDLPSHGKASSAFTRQMMFDQMLSAFKKHRISGVYGFLNAQKIAFEPLAKQLLLQWINQGHWLANHTYSHQNLKKLSAQEFANDILRNEPILQQLMPKTKNYKYFRYPFLSEGNTHLKRNKIRRFLKDHGYQIAQVTIDWEDWAWNTPLVNCLEKNAQQLAADLEKQYIDFALAKLKRAQLLANTIVRRPIAHILLIHIGAMNAKAMDRLLTAYEKADVEFIALSDALKDPIYQINPQIISRSGENFLDQIMQSRQLNYPSQLSDSVVPVKSIQTICE